MDKDKNNPRTISLSDEQLTEVTGGGLTSRQACPVCKGKGYTATCSGGITSVGGVCPVCNGTGRISMIAEFDALL